MAQYIKFGGRRGAKVWIFSESFLLRQSFKAFVEIHVHLSIHENQKNVICHNIAMLSKNMIDTNVNFLVPALFLLEEL